MSDIKISEAAKKTTFLPWNHPLRLEAERLVQQYHGYAQTHLPSDNKKELAEMIVQLVQFTINSEVDRLTGTLVKALEKQLCYCEGDFTCPRCKALDIYRKERGA